MLNSHPLVGASLAALACIAAITAAMDAAASEIYLGAGVAAGSMARLSCGNGALCERPDGISSKISGGYLASLAPVNGVEIAQGVEVMAYASKRGKTAIHTAEGLVNSARKSSGVALSQVLQASMGDLAVRARLGVGYLHGELDYANGKSGSKNHVAPVIGLGIRYTLDKNWSLAADWDRLPARYDDKQNGTTNLFSIGVSYKF
ncbi:outer membrane beta-barrel protein [Undibacterium sp. TJN25]|uniref:outer membrane beta-barrel protein n=1 Tax=Undibacterium sp. TJN25 TaxID=3413056 RepID=UPI003BF33EC8